ncbi:PAS domain-containing protein [Xinfangfangia sp. CPCC 101601]|uniref:PAS domain-containing protein n=1 Tax=Pseudogemmobacter lacusdianii TaxID=3069608 RepID=A0ABU0VXJ1_9RHOB|nr:PAS domain-containing protein [Xinfangfangia sp. CPCC 101601]MDQ2065625.1 PAS domain-containing protein [Xinfangfangia sp. CPCC 101601]
MFTFFGGSNSGETQDPTLLAAARGPAEVRAYWQALRQGGAIPARSDLDPRGMADVLDRVFVGESIAPGLVLLRIAGHALSQLTGIEAKGLPLSVLFTPEARAQLAKTTARVLAGPVAAEFTLKSEATRGRPELGAKLLLLPLCNREGRRNLVLGCLAPLGEIGIAPRRFGIAARSEEHLGPQNTRAMSRLPPVVPAAKPSETPAHNLAQLFEQIGAESPRPARAKPGRSHLRLVHSS